MPLFEKILNNIKEGGGLGQAGLVFFYFGIIV
jgi:hypothetical protein